MTSPLRLYTLQNSKFDISIADGMLDEYENPNDLNHMRRYIIQIPSDELDHLGISADDVKDLMEGMMSPVDDVTLPPVAREKSGVSKNARKFAFLYPPLGLAAYLKERQLIPSATEMNEFDFESPVKPLLCLAVYGAFIYFDDKLATVGTNILSPFESNHKIFGAGPFKTSPEANKELRAQRRFFKIPLDDYQEAGLVERAWVRPSETFHSKQATGEFPCEHGAFVLARESGNTMTYAITTSLKVDMTGDFEEMMDFVLQEILAECVDSFIFSPKCVTCESVHEWKGAASTLLRGQKQAIPVNLNHPRHQIRNLIKAGSCVEELKKAFEDEDISTSHFKQDEYGWNYLHYACCFSPRSYESIEMMIKYNPHSVLQCDRFHRYPLHLACDNGASVEVVKLLLDKDPENVVLLQKTLLMKRLPLDIACSRGADESVIRALLEGDNGPLTIRQFSSHRRSPLNLAIMRGLSANVIEMLLQADSRLSPTGFNTAEDDIYRKYIGMLPIHIACWCRRSTEIVELLISKDSSAKTIFETINDEENTTPLLRPSDHHTGEIVAKSRSLLKSNEENISLNKSISFDETSSLPVKKPSPTPSVKILFRRLKVNNMRALHFCVQSSSSDTTRLLLQKEKQHIMTNKNARQRNATLTDGAGRTCLHLACMNNMEPDIIHSLLSLDPSRVSTTLKDNEGFTPLHYACNHKTSRNEVVRMLLAAEKEYYKLAKDRNFTLSTNALTIHGRNPLWHAIRSEAPRNVIETLFLPEHFDLNGVDSTTIAKAAKLIKSDGFLQQALNKSLSQRKVFLVHFIFLLLDFCVLVAYFYAVEVFLYGSEKNQDTSLVHWYTIVILVCAILLVVRELVNFLSQKGQYFLQIRNLYEWANISLVFTIIRFTGNDMNDDRLVSQRVSFIIIGVSLCFHLMFSLRSTFLPFARFAVGLSAIFITLIPFIVVSCLALILFVFIFRTYYHKYRDTSMGGESGHCPDSNDTCVQCTDSFPSCFYKVLGDFFSGPETTENVLDIIYDTLSVIVLLNVVIAIVSSAWDKADDKASFFYWRGRLEFLSESRWLFNQTAVQFSVLDNFFEWVDSAKGLLDEENQISWQKDAPYNQVQTREQYLDPFHHFDPKLAKVIKEGHSLKADLRWIVKDPNVSEPWKRRYLSFCAILKWTLLTFVYFLLLVLGVPTFGMLWPESFRTWVLSFGNKVESDEDDVDFLVLDGKIVEVGKRTDDLHTKLDVLTSAVLELAKQNGAGE